MGNCKKMKPLKQLQEKGMKQGNEADEAAATKGKL